MDQYDIKRLALVLAIQAEIEGMKAENKQRKVTGNSLAYSDEQFQNKAIDLRNLAYANNEQL